MASHSTTAAAGGSRFAGALDLISCWIWAVSCYIVRQSESWVDDDSASNVPSRTTGKTPVALTRVLCFVRVTNTATRANLFDRGGCSSASASSLLPEPPYMHVFFL